ncbi:efflux transporter outer membrane subunit [Pelomonas sp. KK5]|uniref:efflux transporter outer membrane subunit n=1 Tax=Pelomonas sp. KK5 TaxID=1855730 RepID=UPI00097CA176|nr:efflux transporter outer membrane subunit [Pelomonas sp. KK5]
MKLKLALLSACLALAGCVNLAPDHKRPEASVASQWPAASATAGTPATELGWQSFYGGDARLRELIALSLANNRDLRVAVLNVEQARAQARVADASRYPTLSGGFIGNATPASGTIAHTYQFGATVSGYEVDLFSKVKNQSDAATARYLATAEGQRAAQITLVAGVASAYLALQADEELLQLAADTVTSRDESLRLNKLKFDAGAASSVDLNTAESSAAQARAALSQAERQRAQDLNALTLLVGQPLPAALPKGQVLSDLKLADIPAGLPSQVLAARPDVLQAEQTLAAAEANVGAARAAYFPSIQLTGSYGFASTALKSLFDGTAWTWTINALAPIFDAGRTKANVEATKAAQGIAVAQYEKAVQTAFREVADALAGRATYGEQLAAQQRQAVAATETLRLVDLRYRNGASSSLDLLNAQSNAFAAQQALVQVRLAGLLNSVQLYKVLGGGLV